MTKDHNGEALNRPVADYATRQALTLGAATAKDVKPPVGTISIRFITALTDVCLETDGGSAASGDVPVTSGDEYPVAGPSQGKLWDGTNDKLSLYSTTGGIVHAIYFRIPLAD